MDVNRALAELQLLEQLVAELQARIINLTTAVAEHEGTLRLIDEMKKNPGRIPILLPAGAGNYVKADLVNENTIHVNVGAGVVMEKSLEDSQQIIMTRNETLRKLREDYAARLEQYSARAQELRRLIESSLTQQRKQGQ